MNSKLDESIAIKVSNLTKIYHLYDKPQDRLKEALNPFKKSYHHDFYAMNDVSFEIKKGETVGIIGKNGAGKSTLLKMITGVLTPTSGSIEVTGKIASLLELGAGFNPDMTGIENIYLNGTLMGYTKEEIDTKVDTIIDFADLGEFIYQPIKSYSSGMLARLGFAVSINVDPDILIVDEALGVGDMNFQAKCMTAMDRIQKKGTTILFVSHDIGSVKSLCKRGIYIKNGELTAIGNASDIAEIYIREMRETSNETCKQVTLHPKVIKPNSNKSNNIKQKKNLFRTSKEFDKRVSQFRYGTGEVRTTFIELLNMDNELLTEVVFNQEVKIRIHIEALKSYDAMAAFEILDHKKINIAEGNFQQFTMLPLHLDIGDKRIVEYNVKLPLARDNYSITTYVTSGPNDQILYVDVIPDAYVFNVSVRPEYPLWAKVDLFPSVKVLEIT